MTHHPQADVASTYVEDFSPGGDETPDFNEARDAAYGPQTDSVDAAVYAASSTTPETFGMPAANDLLYSAAAVSDQQEGGLGNVLAHVGSGIEAELTENLGGVGGTVLTSIAGVGAIGVAAALAPAVTTLALIGGAAFVAWKFGEWAFGIADDVAVAWDPNSHSAAEIAEAESNLRGTGAGLTHIIAGSAGGLVVGGIKSGIVRAIDKTALRSLTGIGDDILNVSDDALGATAKSGAAKPAATVADDIGAATGKTAGDKVAADAQSWLAPVGNKVRYYAGNLPTELRFAGKQLADDIGGYLSRYERLGKAIAAAGGRFTRDVASASGVVSKTAKGVVEGTGKTVNDGIAAVGTRVNQGFATVGEGLAAKLKLKPKGDEPKPATVADDAKPATAKDGAKPNLIADILSGKKFVDAGKEIAGGAQNVARFSQALDSATTKYTTPFLKFVTTPSEQWKTALIPASIGATMAYEGAKDDYFAPHSEAATVAMHDGGQVKVLGNIVDDSGQPTAALIQNSKGQTFYATVEGENIIARPFALNPHDDPGNYPHIAWADQFSYVDVPANMVVSMV